LIREKRKAGSAGFLLCDSAPAMNAVQTSAPAFPFEAAFSPPPKPALMAIKASISGTISVKVFFKNKDKQPFCF
jgi:hypothetical protein